MHLSLYGGSWLMQRAHAGNSRRFFQPQTLCVLTSKCRETRTTVVGDASVTSLSPRAASYTVRFSEPRFPVSKPTHTEAYSCISVFLQCEWCRIVQPQMLPEVFSVQIFSCIKDVSATSAAEFVLLILPTRIQNIWSLSVQD